ncbi:hypothetical protein CEXT_69021 [Caerostris extrusa]|uniref:Uncharacterized protein n=1 Tax=Caerostris extrusa TaxID=172846 RepID=A0AAV4TFL1_CAEEX|nr:hypothetical protein CEXT_69021 [Caerostris extrusa]
MTHVTRSLPFKCTTKVGPVLSSIPTNHLLTESYASWVSINPSLIDRNEFWSEHGTSAEEFEPYDPPEKNQGSNGHGRGLILFLKFNSEENKKVKMKAQTPLHKSIEQHIKNNPQGAVNAPFRDGWRGQGFNVRRLLQRRSSALLWLVRRQIPPTLFLSGRLIVVCLHCTFCHYRISHIWTQGEVHFCPGMATALLSSNLHPSSCLPAPNPKEQIASPIQNAVTVNTPFIKFQVLSLMASPFQIPYSTF